MRLLLCLFLTAADCMALGDQPVVEVDLPVTTNPVMDLAVQRAHLIVNELYAEIGVRVVWGAMASARSACTQEGLRRKIVVDFADAAPPGLHTDVFAFSNPYSTRGPCVTLLMNQIVPAVRKNPISAGYLLGYVLAHEIGHVLQGVGGHSETGVMKARLSQWEIVNMPKDQLHFTAHDAELIQKGFSAVHEPHEPPLLRHVHVDDPLRRPDPIILTPRKFPVLSIHHFGLPLHA